VACCVAGFRLGQCLLWVITGVPLPPPIVRFLQLRTSRSIGFVRLRGAGTGVPAQRYSWSRRVKTVVLGHDQIAADRFDPGCRNPCVAEDRPSRLARASGLFHRSFPGGRSDRCRRPPRRQLRVGHARPADRGREQVGRQRQHRHRVRGEKRARRLHGAGRVPRRDQQPAHLQDDRRSAQGVDASGADFAPADCARGASFARRRHAFRIDGAGEAAAGPPVRYRQRRRLVPRRGGAVVREARRYHAQTGAVPGAAPR